jgi:inner membrane protein
MMAGSHAIIGAAAWVWAAPHLGLPPLDPAALALACAGALLPDIDHPRSWVGMRLRIVSRPLAAAIGHRGLTHSLLAAAVCLLLLGGQGASRAIVAPLFVGYLSHLGADLLTPGGLPLAWPLKRRFSLPLCKTGSRLEPLLVAGLALGTAAATFGLLPFSGL